MNPEVEPRTVLLSAAVLVLDAEHRALTLWSNTYGGVTLPGGKGEPEDPSPRHTAVRELAEETGLVVGIEALWLLYTAVVRFRLRDGSPAPARETHLFYAQRVTGRARSTAADRPLGWCDYSKLIAVAPAFYADFYKAALPPNRGFALFQPTEGV
jgi:8-oxo-dGTP pyrophosphatase MutT (NUDIX family)